MSDKLIKWLNKPVTVKTRAAALGISAAGVVSALILFGVIIYVLATK